MGEADRQWPFIRLLPNRHDGVDVWSVTIEGPARAMSRMYELLSQDEQRRATGYHAAHSRDAFVMGRAALRIVLSEYTGVDLRELRLEDGANGRPELPRQTWPALQFNCSHADGLVLVAVARCSRLGIDVERLRHVPEADQIIARFATSGERAVWQAIAPQERQLAFFRWWTRKEAYLKATREGLGRPLSTFDVTLAPGTHARLLPGAGRVHAAERWSLIELLPEPGFLATVAIERLEPDHG